MLQTVEHAGYQRTVISRNPPLIDEDGYELDSDDDEERIAEVQAAAAEDDPYSGIRIDGTTRLYWSRVATLAAG